MTDASRDLTGWASDYIVDSRTVLLDDAVLARAKMHLLDGIIAIASGTVLKPGRVATAFVESREARGRATVAGKGVRTAPELAAFANGVCAHSDETDDVNDLVRIHPGASIVPATLAMAETLGRTGEQVLRALWVGYNLGCGIVLTAWEAGAALRRSMQSTHGVGQLFGAAAAAASLSSLSAQEIRFVLSYTAQQVAGFPSFTRDTEHIEKAFAMGGRQARDGVYAVELVRAGFTGVDDVFDGSPNFFDAYGLGGDPGRFVESVQRPHMELTDLKQYPVGMSIQAAAQALEELMHATAITAENVEHIEAHLPAEKAPIVDGSRMPSFHLQYVLAVLVVDGRLTFENTHDYDRQDHPAIRELLARITLVHDPELNPPIRGEGSTRRASVTVRTRDGQTHQRSVDPAHGSRLEPLTWSELDQKARNVLSCVMPESRAARLVEIVSRTEELQSIDQITAFLGVVGDDPTRG